MSIATLPSYLQKEYRWTPRWRRWKQKQVRVPEGKMIYTVVKVEALTDADPDEPPNFATAVAVFDDRDQLIRALKDTFIDIDDEVFYEVKELELNYAREQ